MLELIQRHFLTLNELGYKKMSKFITLGAMGAEQLQKQMCKEFCGTPCISEIREAGKLFEESYRV